MPMLVYEIRILNEDSSAAMIVAATHLNDHAAIRSGRNIASGRALEVWRDLECIYREPVDGSNFQHHAA
jgi:hypothetical protein